MSELCNLGISTTTISSMLEMCPGISSLTSEEITIKIEILKSIKCTQYQITNIISSNPSYLKRATDKIISLINKLSNLRFSSLSSLFDANPYILNIENDELDEYINNRVDNGESLEEIVDDLDSIPYLFNTI